LGFGVWDVGFYCWGRSDLKTTGGWPSLKVMR